MSKKSTQGIVYHDDDRGVDLRLRVVPGQEPRVVTLAEPSILQLSQIQSIVKRVDEKMPTVSPLPDAAMDDKAAFAKLMKQRNEELAAQTEWIIGDDLPYGTAWREIIAVLAPDEDVALEDLPSALSNPETAGNLLRFYKAPLPGPVET